jgi:hypothetical protein
MRQRRLSPRSSSPCAAGRADSSFHSALLAEGDRTAVPSGGEKAPPIAPCRSGIRAGVTRRVRLLRTKPAPLGFSATALPTQWRPFSMRIHDEAASSAAGGGRP